MRHLLALACLVVPLTAGAQQADSADGPFSAVFRGVPLAEALQEVVELTEIDLVYDASLIAEHRAYCSRRRVSAERLLGCILQGSGLDFVRSSSGAYVLIVSPRKPARRARLAGRVVDADSGEPMPYAHVMLADAGTTADLNGQFAFSDLLPGEHTVVATFVGYEAVVLDRVWVEPGANEHLIVRLRPSEEILRPIVVDGLTQRLPSAALGHTRAAEAAPAMLAATSDVMRGAASTVGVSSALPLADLHIQGGSTAEHVTRLDGVPVRDPVSLGRFLGAFSPLAIRDVNVHKAGFGAREGSLVSGAIDIRHDVTAAAAGGALQLDPVSVNARVSAPVAWPGVGGGVMVAHRQSTFGVYNDPGIADLLEHANLVDPLITGWWLGQPLARDDIVTQRHVPDVAFSDTHAAIRLRPDEYSSVNASLFRAGNFVAADRTVSVPYAGGLERLLTFSDVYDWTNWAGQIQYSRLLGARATMMVRARGSHHASSYVYHYSHAPPMVDGRHPSSANRPMSSAGSQPTGSDSGHRLVETGLDAEVALSLAPGRDVELGLSADLVDARFHGENAFVAPFEVREREVMLAGFLQTQVAAGRRTTVESGVRLTALPTSGRVFGEPRAAVRFDGDARGIDGYAVRLSGGLYRQFVNGFAFSSAGPAALVPELWFWLPLSPDGTPPRSFHAAAEVLLLPAGGWTVRAEAYRRWEPHLLALDVPMHLANDAPAPLAGDLAEPASGRAIGAGAGVQWAGRAGSVAIAYSFEQSRRTTPSHSEPVAVPWEEPHRLSADTRVRLGNGFGIEAAGRGVWGRSWGLRRAYYDYVARSATGSIAEGLGDPASDRLPALLLVDTKLTYGRSVAGAGLRLELGVANLLNRENVVDWSLAGEDFAMDRIARTLPGRRLTFSIRADI